MTTLSIDTLPLEIIYFIANYLDYEHAPSLLAFACVNKFCYSAAAPFPLSTIKFCLCEPDPELVAEQVQEYAQIMRRRGGFRYLRRVVINARPPETRRQLSAAERGHCDDRGLLRPSEYAESGYSAEAAYEINHVWEPLANLIRELPALADLLYSCRWQFPPCLLDALHETQPRCRLYIYEFRLHTLSAPVTDPYEYKLSTSPCLYSVYHQTNMIFENEGENPDYHKETILRMVGGSRLI